MSNGCDDEERKLRSRLNPGCGECGEETTLVHTRADGRADSVHTLWDASGGKPTVIVAHTGLADNLTVAWAARRPVAFAWTAPPSYSFAFVIDEVWEFDDVNDTGVWSRGSPTERMRAARLAWRRVRLSGGDAEVTLSLRAGLGPAGRAAGYIALDLRAVSSRRASARLPHLPLDGNSSLAEVALVNASAGRFPRSRLALSLRLLSSDAGAASWRPELVRSLDDEHTPGIFEMWRVSSPETQRAGDGGFLQLRPVCYTAAAREVTASTLMSLSAPRAAPPPPPTDTAARYFADHPADRVLSQTLLATFGAAGDGFYTRTNYTAWAASMGWGRPPSEQLSSLVVGVMAAGVGGAAALAVGGGVWLAVRAARRCRANRHELLVD